MLHGFQVVGHSMIYVHTHQGQYVANHVRYKLVKAPTQVGPWVWKFLF